MEPRAAERAAGLPSRTTGPTPATPPSSGATGSPTTATSSPGAANGIGFEDLVAIEDYEFLNAVARGERYEPGFDAALDYVAVQAALIRSWESGGWETVVR